MSGLTTETVSTERQAPGRDMRPGPFGLRVMVAATLATTVVGFGMLPGPSKPAKADDPGKGASSTAAASRPASIREMQRTLKANDDRLIALIWRVLEEPDSPQSLRDQLVNSRVTAKSDEAQYENAKLERMVAEIALRGYRDAAFVQDLQNVEGDLILAKQELELGRVRLDAAKQRQARIKEVADENTAYGRMVNYDCTDRIASAILEKAKREAAVKTLEGQKKMLVEYTKPRRIKELESDLAKARSDELAKWATRDLSEVKVTKLEKMVRDPWPSSSIGKRLLALLDRAGPIEEQLHAKLDQFAKATEPGEAIQQEIRELTKELDTIINEAEAAKSADDYAKLNARLRQAAR